jgi:hypothetical protein
MGGRAVGVALAGLALLVAGACSTGADPAAAPATSTERAAPGTTVAPSTTPTSLSPAQAKHALLEGGYGICQEVNLQVADLGAQAGGTPDGQATALQETSDIFARAVVQLQALPQPVGDEAQLDTIYADAGTVADDTHQLAQAVRQGNQPLIRQLTVQGTQDENTLNHAFDAYGLYECGAGPSVGQ